jgi:CRISPR type I-D-associated protein Csc3/Cas10d
MASSLSVHHRAYFRSELINRLTQQYESTLLKSLIQHHVLTTAKGSSRFTALADAPYYIHILNGLYPALLLLEWQSEQDRRLTLPEVEPFLRCLIVGFTFHDLNKLIGVEPLEKAVKEGLEQQSELLKVADFFPEWRDYLPEIEFLALGTENRTATWAFSRQIREWHFVNETLRPICHFADSLASIDSFGSVSEFYEQVCAKIRNVRGGSAWNLSYVEVHDNISVLLSQKLLNIAKSIIQAERKEQVLFTLHSGFVYFGGPLTTEEIDNIRQKFSSEEAELNPVALTKIDHQSCEFGFIGSTSLTREILESVIKEKLQDLLKTAKDINELIIP